MLIGLVLAAFLAAPFWETSPPGEWSDEQIQSLLSSSPWARSDQQAAIYLVSAEPVWQAEQELRRRHPRPAEALEDASVEEYIEFMEDNRDKYIVVAVPIPLPQFLAREKQKNRMENKSVLVVGKKKHKMVGHFPPTSGDRYLRLVFPRVVEPTEKSFFFDLYVPGIERPYRMLRFDVETMTYRGKPEW